MASLVFLWIDGIIGESKDPRHLREIDIESFSFGPHRANVSGPSSPITANINDISFIKLVDGASSAFHLAASGAQRFPVAILSVEKARGGRSAGKVLEFVIRDVIVFQIRPGVSNSGLTPVEEISIRFGSISQTDTANQ